MNKIETLIAEYEVFQKQFQDKSQQLFKDVVREFFKAVPEINVIKWTQYTPYFNDGDACVFNLNEVCVGFASDPSDVSAWGDYNGDTEGEWACGIGYLDSKYCPTEVPQCLATDETKKDAIKELESFFSSSAMEQVFKEMFGDHVMVTVTPEGIDVSDYDHD